MSLEQLGRRENETEQEFARRRELARALAKLVIEEEVLPWIIANSTNGIAQLWLGDSRQVFVDGHQVVGKWDKR